MPIIIINFRDLTKSRKIFTIIKIMYIKIRRTELPDNLKALFISYVIIVQYLKEIYQYILMSDVFSNDKSIVINLSLYIPY